MDASDAARLLRAIRFAAEQHRDDRRKGQVAAPYINHPIAVAEQLAAAGQGGDVELLMAAVLHDVVEDTECSPQEMERAFGPAVTRIVLEVSDDKTLEKERRKAQVVETIAHKSRAARLIKLSDLIANVHDVLHHPPQWPLERKLRYLEWAEQVAAAAAGTHATLEAQLQALIEEARHALGALAAAD